MENVPKNFLTVISNGTAGFKLFTLIQVIDEHPGVTFPGIYYKSKSQREVIEIFAESIQC